MKKIQEVFYGLTSTGSFSITCFVLYGAVRVEGDVVVLTDY